MTIKSSKFFQKIAGTNVRRVLLFWVLLLFVGAALFIFKVALYTLPEDISHTQYKQQYLQKIAPQAQTEKPNIVLIFFDDLGYGDLGVYGSQAIKTPNIDTLATQGTRLTNFYSASPVCSPSRASLLTGRYPIRTGIDFVLFQESSAMMQMRKLQSKHSGLPRDEITIAEVLKATGYATAMIGKWHLGDTEPSLPNNFGFDEFYGVLYSNDLEPLDLYRNREITETHPIDQSQLTEKYTQEAIRFIQENQKKPFFLYLPHTFPHIPLYPDKKFAGNSSAGTYGDVVEDLDRSVGKIMKTLEELQLQDNTIVILTSDNGPWYQGSPGLARGRKMETFEGGMRVPFIIRWPEKIPENTVNDAPTMAIDVFPSILGALSLELPSDRQIDGENIFPMLQQNTNKDRQLLFCWKDDILAIREGKFKYHSKHLLGEFNPTHPIPWSVKKGPWLFDLSLDKTESYDVSSKYTEVTKKLEGSLLLQRSQMKNNPRGWRKP